MKNKFIILILLLLINSSLFAENILIEAKNISLDKDKKTSIFEDNVTITTKKKIIKSEYVEHDKIKGQLIIKKNVVRFNFLS